MSLSRRDRDLVELSVLALLLAGPKHTYEMHRMMVDAHKDFVTGLPRSMYHAVGRLTTGGQIAQVASERDGPAPERTVLQITDLGRNTVRERLERLLSTPDPDSTVFAAALSFLTCLPPALAARALRQRIDALTEHLDHLQAQVRHIESALPRALLVETEYDCARLTAERAWVRTLVDDIDSERLSWPDEVEAFVAELGKGAPLP